MSRPLAWPLSVVCLLALLLGRSANAQDPKPTVDAKSLEFFEKQVRPLLTARCFECHSGKADKPKGGLRLDSRAAAIAGGDTGSALVPGNPQKSLLIDAINYGELYQMPPKNKLADNEIAILTRWVKLGAPWPDERPVGKTQEQFNLGERKAKHWAWKPIGNPQLPEVRDTDWPADPLDYFILSRLEKAGLHPAPHADKRALLRRVYFDLIGLPPTADEVQAFLNDTADDAFQRLVDRLLESEHFGERWARHWMDLVRYAETYGHEFDYPLPHASAYRDYVIRAFNADVPYNQFVKEHLAGDLLPEPRRHPELGFNESIIGTGFWWLGEATHAPVDVRADEAGRIDNQIDVMSKSFLGITVACARCHDHKFDAISTKDYYALAGFLQSSRRQEAFLDNGGAIAAAVRQLDGLRDQAAEHIAAALPTKATGDEGPAAELQRRLMATSQLKLDASAEQVRDVAQQHQLNTDRLQRWMTVLNQESVKQPGHPLHPWWKFAFAAQPATAEQFRAYEKHLRADRERASKSLKGSKLFADFSEGGITDWKTTWTTTGEAFGKGPTGLAEWDAIARGRRLLPAGWFHSGRISPKLQGVLRSPTFTLEQPHIDYHVRGKGVQLRVILDGYFMDVYNGLLFGGFTTKNLDTKDRVIWHRQSGDLRRYLGHKAYLEIIDHGDGFAALDQIRFSTNGVPVDETNPTARVVFAQPNPVASLQSLAAAYDDTLQAALAGGKSEQPLLRQLLENDLLVLTGDPSTLDGQLAEVAKQIDAVQAKLPRPQRVLAMTDGTSENERVHIRGNHRTLGDEVPRRLLEALPHQVIQNAGSGRLQLANDVASPANPLTSRVFVNRVWHHLFGRGIVATTDNFGILGQRPTHPELLDHLAQQFLQEGWSVKRLLRRVVLSKTYRMASHLDPQAEQADPNNLLLHRAPIRRLQAESIRDAILSVSGRLDRKVYGPTVPVHITPFMQGRGRPGGSGPLDGSGRRSVYIAVRRNFLAPMMLAYDVPIPFSSVGRRNVSNVPAQALILMNDPFVVEQAKVWAQRLLKAKDQTSQQRIDQIYLEAFGREPTDAERKTALAFLDVQGRERKVEPALIGQNVEVWSDLCHVIWNIKEFVYLH